ncbi:VCBS repeat-containing protein [Salegentibacter sp. JZCK2]|uniref:VCBS repeat-containing protein n=1 Tax=Salegentibacter tibetensis TaxID=2873600 RepID=UPI001CCCF0DF|nr:VCBS repeat-containing protein [Salegentibacter tibetensis]MBZ9729339.1 VCBS repeat-containing protein [Salegentibacter tibetensis]
MKLVINKALIFLVLIGFFQGCSENEEKFFSNPGAETSGIDFINKLIETRDQNILDYLYFYNGGGVSIGDINNDGLPDIYFTGNQVGNRLYLNKGNLQFEDITEKAGVQGNSTWNTGSTMADVNGDGLLDIYVCAVVGVNGFTGYNELFINNGDLTFSEKAKEFGLDLENYSSQAAFFDADNDGDLDMYLLNHAIHTNESFGPAEIRNNRVYESGDKLFLNENGKFIDVSEEAGIYGGPNSYGLGISTADFNNDGFTDIYIGNDFHEDDYYYLNNGDGTFTESLKSNFGHVSRFSMGNDAADINNDGFIDLITLDMLPEDEKILKSSAGEDDVNLHNLKIERLGYHPQYSRNMLHLNMGGDYFAEVALMSGVAATDWSWGALFADFDQDGQQDLFITNGIPKRPNDLDYIKYTSNEQIKKKLDQTTLIDNEALDKMPSGAVTNYVFKGNSNGTFENMTDIWIANDSVISTGVAYADLDNDGDIDIVTNNINKPPSLYINNEATGNYLKVKLWAGEGNTSGIGSKAILYTNKGKQYRQLYTTKAYQSSSEPIIHFGIPKNAQIDSLSIVWPDQTMKTLNTVRANSVLEVRWEPDDEKADLGKLFNKKNKLWFSVAETDFGLNYNHEENPYIDFNLQKLIPHKISDFGPAVEVADLNNDGLDDVLFGASRYKPSVVFFQDEEGFTREKQKEIQNDSLYEDTDVEIADFNNDGTQDILMISGGGESVGNSEWLLDRLYINKAGNFKKDSLFPEIYANSSVIKSADFDGDGDLDIFIGSNAVNYKYGEIPKAYLLRNENGNFVIDDQSAVFQELGMINDAVWEDFDNDGDLDLIVVGEWMSPRFLENRNGVFVDVTDSLISEKINGLWQRILPFDIDKDGDTDYLLGNWGLNTKLKASKKYPLLMYYKDFDKNGLPETLLATEKNGEYYFIHGLDDLASQLSELIRKRFATYKDFAGKTVQEIFTSKELETASKREVHSLASGYLENNNGKFTFREFDLQLQVAPIRAMLKYDFNKDGTEEVLIGGNYFGVTPYHGRFDAFGGALLINSDKILNSNEIGLNLSQKSVKDFSIIEIQQQSYLLITINDGKTELYKLNY